MMLHMCRACDGLILDDADAVLVATESSSSGPGIQIWAHREHAHLVQPDPRPIALLAEIRARRNGQR